MTRIRVTVLDEETGDTESAVIGGGPGGYIVTCGPGCGVTDEQRYKNGTVVITIKPIEDAARRGAAT